MKTTKLFKIFICALLLFTIYANQTAHAHFVKPKEGDVCPVCGMSISEHPRWVAVIMFSDGKHVKLHGSKSMFIYYFNLDKYDKKYSIQDVSTMHVTDYSTVKHIKAKEAFYVINSNIQGPMGEELIPFSSREIAEKFTEDHGGDILLFNGITREIVSSMNNIISNEPSITQ